MSDNDADMPVEPNVLVAPAGFESVLVVGAGEAGEIIIRDMQRMERYKLYPVACVDDDESKIGQFVNGVPVVGATDLISALVEAHHIDVVLIAIPSAPTLRFNSLVGIAQRTSARVLSLPHITAIANAGVAPNLMRTVEIKDLLGRPVVRPNLESCRQFVSGQTILVTGAAGSIGSELARQIASLSPEHLILLDVNESDLHDLKVSIDLTVPDGNVTTVITSVTDRERIDRVFRKYKPGIVLHAAAYKHVDAMQRQPDLALETNVVGTRVVVEAAARHEAERFVMVSTDKAVRPNNAMGASKRLAELVVGAVGEKSGLSVCSVRFGNVLGSRGSVIPKFQAQIAKGGPVTVYDRGMYRYFMMIPEAASLVIQAGAFGDRNVTYVLDMGDEVSIYDLAVRMIEGSGLRVDEDIRIEFTGAKPGEKLREILSTGFENATPTAHEKIRKFQGTGSIRTPDEILEIIEKLGDLDLDDAEALNAGLLAAVSAIDPNDAKDVQNAGTTFSAIN